LAKAARALIVWLLLACMTSPVAMAQGKPASKSSTVKPQWSELSPRQQHVLAPLAPEWENLDGTRRKKWVEIANRYPRMNPDEQIRLQKRMQDWAKLSPEQRRVAREKYQTLKKLPPERRQDVQQKWQQYQQTLSPRTTADPATLDTATAVETAAPDAPAGK
jgi:hypothetical protein